MAERSGHRIGIGFQQRSSGQIRSLEILLLIVSLHSIALGLFIYFFTEAFYNLFFLEPVENWFFVRQSGVFLVCLGLFYGVAVARLRERLYLLPIILASKVLAVVFLASNASLSNRPEVIVFAAIIDCAMGCGLGILYVKTQHLF